MRRAAAACRVALLAVALAAPAAAATTDMAAEAQQWLARYLAVDTTNPPGNEGAAAELLRLILHREGIPTQRIVSSSGRTSLYARLRSASPTGGALVLMHHMDVVPAGDGWTVPPFGGIERDGRLWGRGAVDAKSLGIAHLAAFVALARSGLPLTRDVVFLAVADEETGGLEGTRWLLERHSELVEGAAAVLGEGGSNRARGGALAWWGIEVAQKRPLWLRATAGGRGGHGSSLNLHTAPHRLVRGLARLLERPLDLRLTPEARAYFEAVAPYETRRFQQLLPELESVLAGPDPGRHLLPGLPTFVADSIQVNVLAAGARLNVAPTVATAEIDVRMLPDADEDALLAEIRELLGDRIEVEVLLSAPRVAPSPTATEIWSCLADELSPKAPVVPAFIAGITDARYFRERGVPAYGFSPFALGGLELVGVHGPDERIPLDRFAEGVSTMVRVTRRCALATSTVGSD